MELQLRRSDMLARLLGVTAAFVSFSASLARAEEPTLDWSEQQISKLPSGEVPVRLFNGQDLAGWDGQVGKYFNVVEGAIVGKNAKDNAPPASTYLVTKRPYRNFRLIFESMLAESEMHSGIALWGKPVERMGDPFS